jgi:hypothetical protein
MNNIPNTALCRTICLVYVPAFLFLFASSAPAAEAAASDNDMVVIASADALSQADMSANRGGTTVNTTTVTSNQTMDSTSSGNTVNVAGSLTNGPISVGSNFGGSGFGSYVMNTGNNSIINSGVSLSVLMMQ